MDNGDTDLVEHLKSLEGNNYDSEAALFDALYEKGVMLPKGYRSGSRNKDLARKEAERYIEYKPLIELNPNSKKKRAVTITKVRDPPRPKENRRGVRGRYTDKLRPLIVKTALDYPFHGTKAELFDSWGVYDGYKEQQIKTGLFAPNQGHSFNPWKIVKTMFPGETKYCQIISFKERDSLENTLESLGREGVLEWEKCTIFAPLIENTDTVNSITRLKTWKEYTKDCNQRYELVIRLARTKNCVISPEIFRAGLYVSKGTYYLWSQTYYTNNEQLPDVQATAAQEALYENYQSFLRQLTMRECLGHKAYCPPGEVPSKYDIFTDWTYRRKYNELDKSLKTQLLGWEQVRRELSFKVIDEVRAEKYLNAYAPELAFELGCEYILFMDEHMGKEKLYYPKNYTSDFEGVISKEGSERLFTLNTSRSAVQLHKKLKSYFGLNN